MHLRVTTVRHVPKHKCDGYPFVPMWFAAGTVQARRKRCRESVSQPAYSTRSRPAATATGLTNQGREQEEQATFVPHPECGTKKNKAYHFRKRPTTVLARVF